MTRQIDQPEGANPSGIIVPSGSDGAERPKGSDRSRTYGTITALRSTHANTVRSIAYMSHSPSCSRSTVGSRPYVGPIRYVGTPPYKGSTACIDMGNRLYNWGNHPPQKEDQ